jgi:hypothetical protein
MSLFSKLLGCSALLMFITAILFVIFGQITVRKLRKNPATKDRLGMEFVSGWDIFNVAGAFSTPKWLRDRFSRSNLSVLIADYQVLYDNTTHFDRILARIFWVLYITSGSSMILLVILDSIGLFG